MESGKKEFKLVFNQGVARRLIRMGIAVADIKPDRDNSDRTVFVFKTTPDFNDAFEKINNEILEAKAAQSKEV